MAETTLSQEIILPGNHLKTRAATRYECATCNVILEEKIAKLRELAHVNN